MRGSIGPAGFVPNPVQDDDPLPESVAHLPEKLKATVRLQLRAGKLARQCPHARAASCGCDWVRTCARPEEAGGPRQGRAGTPEVDYHDCQACQEEQLRAAQPAPDPPTGSVA